MLASSIAYNAALGLAPLLLILLALSSLVGEDIQSQVLAQIGLIAPDAKAALVLVFKNLKESLDLSSITGLFGLGFLIFLSSLLFTQLRYCFDVIYGDFNPDAKVTWKAFLFERLKLMFVVVVMCVLFTLSLSIGPLFEFFLAGQLKGQLWAFVIKYGLNFTILFTLFTGLYFFTPTKRKRIGDCAKMASLTSLAFMIGNILTGLYMRNVAMDSLYGAAGSLLIFLLWAFYSALTIFVSIEIFEHMRMRKKLRISF